MQIKSHLANIALSIFALVCAFAVGEVVVRLLYKEQTPLYPRYHTDYHYGPYTIRGIRPNAEFWHTSLDGSWKFVTNSKGFRNTKEFSYDKPAGMLRVLSLGDSHTQGYEVRQEFTFSAVLERFLNQNNTKAEVINTGVSGFSTAEELVLLDNEAVKYHPDVVVLGFFDNDFEDNLKAALFSLDPQGNLHEQKYEHIPGVRIQNFIYGIPGVMWLSENSYFYSLLFNSIWNYFKFKLGETAVKNTDASSRSLPSGVDSAISTATTRSDYQIALTAALIGRMHQFCQQRGIRLIIVDIPARLRAYRYTSSLLPALIRRLDTVRIEYIDSQSLLHDFDGLAEIHVAHGHNHISEFTHILIGMEIGRRILSLGTAAVNR